MTRFEVRENYIMMNFTACILHLILLKSLCLTTHHAMKAYWGSGGIDPLILDLGTRGR
jgi:hypothetical protein